MHKKTLMIAMKMMRLTEKMVSTVEFDIKLKRETNKNMNAVPHSRR